jgi:hypothetical protein
MKTIQLTKGFEAIVDDEDYEWLSNQSWHVATARNNSNHYASGHIPSKKGYKHLMHRVILKKHGIIVSNEIVDHINNNGLDNRKINLRVVNENQNAWNKKKTQVNKLSKYKGVSRAIQGKYSYWRAFIKPTGGKMIHLGQFPFTEEGELLAAKKYNEAALIHFGEYANLNKIENET